MRFAGSANLPIINCVTAYRNPKREVNYLKCWTNGKKKKDFTKCVVLRIRGHRMWTLVNEELKGN